jgi:hypothetical protein
MRQTPRLADADVVIPLEVHRDFERAEVVVLPQVHDSLYHRSLGRMRAD